VIKPNDHQLVREMKLFLLATFLPLPSNTQFVESGVKEAKIVSATNRSEQMSSIYAIIRSVHVVFVGDKTLTSAPKKALARIISAKLHSVEQEAMAPREMGEASALPKGPQQHPQELEWCFTF
jgi:hypothetical protein